MLKVHIHRYYFFEENTKRFDVIVGMYHDQVLGPMKTLYGFKAINITIGLPFIRISPDHGPNIQMLGKNKSDPSSLLESIRFLKNMRVKAKKSLGQNFLIDKNILKKIVDVGNINSNDKILEIGPGTGNLTEYIVKANPKTII